MHAYKLSPAAFADLVEISDFGIKTFGQLQAARYHTKLETTFDLLSRFPRIGLPSYDLTEGLYRFPQASHMIFYTHKTDHIVIIPLLHARADFKRFF